MSYEYAERQIVLILKIDLEGWVAANVTGHLGVALGAAAGAGILGRSRLVDRSGVGHSGIARYGLVVKKANEEALREVIRRARENPEIILCDYPQEMLETGHDDDLQAALGICDESDLSYLGAILYGERALVRGICGKLPLWP